MSYNVIPPTQAVTLNQQVQTELEPSTRSTTKATEQPRIKVRDTKSRADTGAASIQNSLKESLKQHTAPRALVRVDQKAVEEILHNGKISLAEINIDKHAAYYKHASMIISGDASDKLFLLRCLVALYVSVPDASHPKATRAGWVDDQNERWGDDLMFLFEHTKQVDELNSAGKHYFLNALLEKASLQYRGKNSEDDLKQALFQAKHRMPVMEDHSA
jgi:hypothetical protein